MTQRPHAGRRPGGRKRRTERDTTKPGQIALGLAENLCMLSTHLGSGLSNVNLISLFTENNPTHH
jgi:hypothetical protein